MDERLALGFNLAFPPDEGESSIQKGGEPNWR